MSIEYSQSMSAWGNVTYESEGKNSTVEAGHLRVHSEEIAENRT